MSVVQCALVEIRRPAALILLLLMTTTTLALRGFADQGAERKDVLILYGLQSHMPIVLDWDRNIRAELESGIDAPVRIETEFLDLLRSQDIEYRDQWISLLRKKSLWSRGRQTSRTQCLRKPELSWLTIQDLMSSFWPDSRWRRY